MSTEVQAVAPSAPQKVKERSLIDNMAAHYGVDTTQFWNTVKKIAFQKDATNEEMMSLMIIANQHGLNPLTGEIHAFKDPRKGVVPVIGVDGWSTIINNHPNFDGMTFSYDKEEEAMTCTMYRKDREHPTVVTEYMDECKRDTGPWKSHPRRMLRHKTMIQAGRISFGLSGIYDPDEAERIVGSKPDAPAPSEQAGEYRTEIVGEIVALLEANGEDENLIWFNDNKDRMFKTIETLEAYRDQLITRLEKQTEEEEQAAESSEDGEVIAEQVEEEMLF